MTDYNEHGEIVVGDPEAGSRAWCHLMYALHAVSAISGILSSAFIVTAFVFGWPSIVAVVINYVTRERVRNSWLATHWRWQLRTFWFAALWGLIAMLFAMTIVGIVIAIPAVVAAGIWVLYRVIRGWLNLLERRAMPLPLIE